jgi:acyl-coenzyme A synthetase/AMP-(fatty) acid ligase
LVFPALAAGGSLFVPRREDILFPKRFYQFVVDEEITFTSFSPSYLRLVLGARQLARLAGSHLRALLLGGEECVAADVEKLWSVLPEVRVFNRYGPTETTIAVTTYEVARPDVASGRIPIGEPHRGTDFFLVSEEGRLVDDAGVPGELFIGGEQLMRGYWGDEVLSRKVLRSDVVPGRTLYKTGDLVWRDGTGRYLYMGRLDDVIKRNGVRISLSEVARAFRDVPGVSAACCALVDMAGSPGIAAFVEAPAEVTVARLFGAAEGRLPPTMLPDEIHVVGSIPMTQQGKVDRTQLLAGSGRTAWREGATS